MAFCSFCRRAAKLSCAVSFALLLSACEESPTGPSSLVRSVDGTQWIAISVPDQLPDLSVWQVDPPAEAFLDAFSSLSSWSDRVRADISRGQISALDSTVVAVRSDLDSAARALEKADTTSAVRHLSHAGESVRAYGPDRVATSLITLVEGRLSRADLDAANSRRAAHLIRAAREAVREGDSMRALRRGLYALQLTAGNGILQIECTAGEEGCRTP